MKIIINLIILASMIASIAVQYNDPDGIVWAIIYGYAAVMAIAALRNKYNGPMLFIGLIGYIAGGVVLLPPELDGWITNELARESGGLFITSACLMAIIVQMFMAKKSAKSTDVVVESGDE